MTERFIRLTSDEENDGKYVDNVPLTDPADGLEKHRQKVVLADGNSATAKPPMEDLLMDIRRVLKLILVEMRVANMIHEQAFATKSTVRDVDSYRETILANMEEPSS